MSAADDLAFDDDGVLVDEWPALAPLSRAQALPAFPADALPDWLRAFVLGTAEATQTPADMAGMFALAALAAVAARRVHVEARPDWIEGTNIFVAVAMEPGSRKSGVHRRVVAPLIELERELMERWRPEANAAAVRRAVLEERRAAALRAAGRAKTDEDREAHQAEAEDAGRALAEMPEHAEPRLLAGDCTPEALASLLSQNGAVALIDADAALFETAAGRYSNGPNLEVFLKGHSGDPLRVDRRGRPSEHVDRPALTIGVAVQPSVMRGAARCAPMVGRGFIDRFTWIVPENNVGYRNTKAPPIGAAVRDAYGSHLLALGRALTFSGPVTLRLSVGASDLLDRWMSDLEPRRRPSGDLAPVRGWASKLDGLTVRLAGLLHVAKSGHDMSVRTSIDVDTMSGAVRVAEYALAHAQAAFDLMDADEVRRHARHVWTWVVDRGERTFTRRDCHRAHRSVGTSRDLSPVLDLLVEHGLIRAAAPSSPARGRPSEVWQVNPTALGRNGQNGQQSGSVLSVPIVPKVAGGARA